MRRWIVAIFLSVALVSGVALADKPEKKSAVLVEFQFAKVRGAGLSTLAHSARHRFLFPGRRHLLYRRLSSLGRPLGDQRGRIDGIQREIRGNCRDGEGNQGHDFQFKFALAKISPRAGIRVPWVRPSLKTLTDTLSTVRTLIQSIIESHLVTAQTGIIRGIRGSSKKPASGRWVGTDQFAFCWRWPWQVPSPSSPCWRGGTRRRF